MSKQKPEPGVRRGLAVTKLARRRYVSRCLDIVKRLSGDPFEGTRRQSVIDRIKLVDVELTHPPQPLKHLGGYDKLKALVRLHGTPVGFVEVPLTDTGFPATELRRIILRRLSRQIMLHHLSDAIEEPLPQQGLGIEELLEVPHPVLHGPLPLITVAVCTRNRTEDLRLCLESLARLDYPRLDILVVDNAPSSDATARLVKGSYPQMRYVCESKPGLDWARNRAILEARGEIIAYTDDDVIVDRGWAAALAAAFQDPQVMAVTGLVVPYELETEAQVLFERYGGFGRGFKRKYWPADHEGGERPMWHLGAGQFGTGANMAYRRGLFERIGPFDPALDVGTVTNGGGDLEMFFRVIKEGCVLAYEPSAVVRHRHRRDYAQLRTQLTNNGIGFYSYLVRTALAYPDVRIDAVRFGLWWFWWWDLRRALKSVVQPSYFPRHLIWAELWGCLRGLGRYPRARRRAAEIASSENGAPYHALPRPPAVREPVMKGETTVGVRVVDLCEPIRGLHDVSQHTGVRVFVAIDDQLVGSVDLVNHHRSVSAVRLRSAIVGQLGLRLLGQNLDLYYPAVPKGVEAALGCHYLPASDDGVEEAPMSVSYSGAASSARLPSDVPVSVVVATYDRPDDLRACLRGLTAQKSARPIEIIVVDNHPFSGLTPPVVAEFPEVTLLAEARQGGSYARNKGFAAARGEIVVGTDDDVIIPADWLEKLVAPFARPDVMVVTGNILPLELKTTAQRDFERYGALGRGYAPKEADGTWFRSFRRRAVPTWELGATANVAFRADIFACPEIGLLEETLGSGTPTGCSEDTYFFYRVLKAGHTILYEPSAYVWHKHRREMRALRQQLYNYSKGHVAYHLLTLLRDHDRRALNNLLFWVPKWLLKKVARYAKRRLYGRTDYYPLRLVMIEVMGILAGPWCLWRSHRRVKRQGRSDPHI